MASSINVCPLSFLKQREYNSSHKSWNPYMTASTFLSSRLDSSTSLYRRDLFSHFGCVNAIEFSSEGCLLVSGGDDRRVLLWNLESSISEGSKPIPMKVEHNSNIFCLSFDANNAKIFSAGNDEQVIVHDIETGESVNVFHHTEAIYGVSGNPYCDAMFASAGEDGRVLLCDTRTPRAEDHLLLARSYDPFHAVQFHPIEPKFIVTANPKDGVVLWDVRKPLVPFLKYGDRKTPESSMSARFNSDGSQIIALRRRLPPILFNTLSEPSVCQFDSDHYYNSCTMKSCCFAGSRDQFVLSGSDDFNLYMWRIPQPSSEVKFIGDAHMVLRGHRSIVNQVRFNPHNFTIASSGVEKIVKLWSPIPVPGSYGALDNDDDRWMDRRVYTHEEYIGFVLDSGQNVSHDYSNGSTSEDPRMMAFFDSLVQREVEGWTTNTDEEDHTSTHSSSNLQSDDSETESSSSNSSPGTSFSSLVKRTSQKPCGPPSSGPRKRAPGSEWILRLIAKKRAQLRAAKRSRKLNKKRLKTRKYIRSLSTQHKRFTYRPQALRFNEQPISSLEPVESCLRLPVAPYTFMAINNFLDSDLEEDDDSDATPGPSGIRSSKILWSSSDEESPSKGDKRSCSGATAHAQSETLNAKKIKRDDSISNTPLVDLNERPPPFYSEQQQTQNEVPPTVVSHDSVPPTMVTHESIPPTVVTPDSVPPTVVTPDSGVSSASATTPESCLEDKSEPEENKKRVSFKKVPQCRLNKYRPRAANDSE